MRTRIAPGGDERHGFASRPENLRLDVGMVEKEAFDDDTWRPVSEAVPHPTYQLVAMVNQH